MDLVPSSGEGLQTPVRHLCKSWSFTKDNQGHLNYTLDQATPTLGNTKVCSSNCDEDCTDVKP
jgi:hypothetical protein